MKLIKQSSDVRACSVRIKGNFKHSGWSLSTLFIFESRFTAHKELHYWGEYVISLWIICILLFVSALSNKICKFQTNRG